MGEEPSSALKLADGRELPLPEALAEALLALAGELSTGHAVRVLAAQTTLSPAEAAEVLGLSRLFVVRLLDEGVIPSEHLPGSRHRAVRLEDVLEFHVRGGEAKGRQTEDRRCGRVR